jgi:hypothetical protein
MYVIQSGGALFLMILVLMLRDDHRMQAESGLKPGFGCCAAKAPLRKECEFRPSRRSVLFTRKKWIELPIIVPLYVRGKSIAVPIDGFEVDPA